MQVLGKPWLEVPVQFGASASASSPPEKVSRFCCAAPATETYALLFGQTGEHVVKLELAVPISTARWSPGKLRAVPPVGITTFELRFRKPIRRSN